MPLLPFLDFVKLYPDELSVIKHYISICYGESGDLIASAYFEDDDVTHLTSL